MEPLEGPSGCGGPGLGSVQRGESVGRLAQCGHQYHLPCLVTMYNNGNKDGRYSLYYIDTLHTHALCLYVILDLISCIVS